MTPADELLKEVKNHLRITWVEEDTDIVKLIDRAKSYFKSVTGADLDFFKDGQAKHLLLERCRYVYNRSAEEFENNFRHEIINLQLSTAVAERRERLGKA
ncbi:head-tail connector protein [Sporosarcina saromensis]|uniref:Head-tail connector protein n=1 Tax=Sporosarcina saromensis TaxID=359365 RepID=A0ABU4G7B4_9BACL|nr:head-tail connector protein [Sporosarcina saromensis]MDW0112210.1 head-tail connector protein [Sporosarcina saromensis]